MKISHLLRKLLFILLPCSLSAQSPETTYAEKLGYPPGSRLLILHVDDAGMSYESNEGAIQALTKGVANSVSVLMPCPWVPGFVKFLKKNPGMDAGLHLTLNSEWNDYRWGPLSGKTESPGLTDTEGAMWSSVEKLVQNASAAEVEKELEAQLNRAKAMDFHPTHFDSHMGALFASPAFLETYIRFGIKHKTPVMIPAGEASLIRAQMNLPEETVQQLRSLGRMLWESGLVVIDDLHNSSYDWKPGNLNDRSLQKYKTEKYIEGIRSLKPGITMMIMHCTQTSEIFKQISDSGPTRKGDLLAMLDPALKKAIYDEKIIMVTWKSLQEKRNLLTK